MKKEIEAIRELIRKDEIEKALEKTRHISPDEISDILIMLSSRYQKWKREKIIGLGDNAATRNSVIHDLLQILTELESE